MAADGTPDTTKKTTPATAADISAPKATDAPATPHEVVHSDVAAGKLADPVKLQADSTITAASAQSWSKPTPDLTAPLLCDNIYNTTSSSLLNPQPLAFDLSASLAQPQAVGGNTLADKACTIDDYKSAFDVPPLTLNTPGALNDFSALNSWNTKEYSAYASNMWSPTFQATLDSTATKTLNGVFDDKGDAEKLSGYKPTGLDKATQTQLDSHKNGQSWQVDGTNYFKTDTGALITRNKDQVSYIGPDGLRFDGSKGNGTMTKDGETVVKEGDKFFKKYPDGEQVQITDKGDIASIVKVENMVFEQRRHALKAMTPELLADAKNRGDRTVTGPDGVQVFKVDDAGDVIGKSSKENGAFIRMSQGDMYRVNHGQVYTIKDGKETLVDGALPAGMTRGADGSISIGTVTLSKDNKYTDTAHKQHMNDMTASTTIHTEKGPVTASVDNGKESVKTPDHNFVVDPTIGKDGGVNVFNNDGTKDLSFDTFTNTLSTDGANWGPNGLTIGDQCFNNDDSVTDLSGNDVFANSYATYSDDSQQDVISSSDDAAVQVTTDAGSDVAEATGDLSAGTISFGDVGELDQDLASLSKTAGLNLDTTSRATVERELAAVTSAMPEAERQAQASQIAASLGGGSNLELTKAIMDGGSTDPILRRWGLMPLEIFDAQEKVA